MIATASGASPPPRPAAISFTNGRFMRARTFALPHQEGVCWSNRDAASNRIDCPLSQFRECEAALPVSPIAAYSRTDIEALIKASIRSPPSAFCRSRLSRQRFTTCAAGHVRATGRAGQQACALARPSPKCRVRNRREALPRAPTCDRDQCPDRPPQAKPPAPCRRV